MKYHNVTKDDMLNGDGLRVVLWVAGCDNKCQGCQNPGTWDPDIGLPFDDKVKEEIYEELDKDYVSGITFSGGDPMYCSNAPVVIDFAREIKEKYPGKTIWFWTGSTWEAMLEDPVRRPMLEIADVCVDGPFMIDQRDTNLWWRGSSNQRVIDCKKSLKENAVVLHCK